MTWEWVFPLLGGIGIGSLLNTLLQAHLKSKTNASQRAFIEKRKAYLELLTSIGDIRSKGDIESKAKFAVAVERIALVGSPEVYSLVKNLTNTSPNSKERGDVQNSLVVAMRNDLKIDIRPISDSLHQA